jgi:hypothetical protein
MAGVGKDAAIAEGAWAEFHLAARPGEHATIGDEIGGGGAGFFQGTEFTDLDFSRERSDGGLDGRIIVSGAEEGDGHPHIRDGLVLGSVIKGRAEGRAVIAGSGLDVDVVE